MKPLWISDYRSPLGMLYDESTSVASSCEGRACSSGLLLCPSSLELNRQIKMVTFLLACYRRHLVQQLLRAVRTDQAQHRVPIPDAAAESAVERRAASTSAIAASPFVRTAAGAGHDASAQRTGSPSHGALTFHGRCLMQSLPHHSMPQVAEVLGMPRL